MEAGFSPIKLLCSGIISWFDNNQNFLSTKVFRMRTNYCQAFRTLENARRSSETTVIKILLKIALKIHLINLIANILIAHLPGRIIDLFAEEIHQILAHSFPCHIPLRFLIQIICLLHLFLPMLANYSSSNAFRSE